jgi:SAM (Sterile alpha motif) domain-containing protein
MDIGGWLRSLGLEEYEAAFRKKNVDAAVLPKLSAEDLKDLGVAAIGVAPDDTARTKREKLDVMLAQNRDLRVFVALCGQQDHLLKLRRSPWK